MNKIEIYKTLGIYEAKIDDNTHLFDVDKNIAEYIVYLQKENQKYKEVIDKANKWVRDYMDEWNMNDEVWQDLNDLLILLEEVEHEKSNN